MNNKSLVSILFIGSLAICLPSLATKGQHSLEELVRIETCQAPTSVEPVVTSRDFSWGQGMEELKARGKRLYQEGKRLEHRAYLLDEETVVVPLNVPRYAELQPVKLTARFLQSVRRHIEEGLRRGYVDSIFFSDMGHSHFFVPQDFYDDVLAPYPIEEKHLKYEKMLAHEGIKILYHTAEQLQMLDEEKRLLEDRHLQWRFFTRNLVGDNQAQGNIELIHAEDHSYNTAGSYQPGYRYWGGGFYITANKNGCFRFNHEGETYFFDLNLEGIDFTAGTDVLQSPVGPSHQWHTHF